MSPLNKSCEELFIELYTNSEVMHWIGCPYSQESARKAFKRVLKENIRQPNKVLSWVIEEKSTGNKIGVIALTRLSQRSSKRDIGTVLQKSAQSLGYAYEAMDSLIKSAKRSLEITKVSARFSEKHLVSRKLVEKLGFKQLENKDKSKMLYWEI